MTGRRRPVTPTCIECGKLGKLAGGATAYPNRPDLHSKMYFVCECGARVGCHPGTGIALGRPCGPETALARDKAHRAFDPIWRAQVAAGRRQGRARNDAYRWLARALGIAEEDCHISLMDLATARRVILLCRERASRESAAG